MKKLSSILREYRILSICIILLGVFVALACFSGAWPGSDFAAQILSALAGAVVAAIITLFLLQGQTESEAKKDKDSKVFEEKLRIYQDFMKELCEVVKDQKIDDEEEIRLQFQVAAIAMHTSEDSILTISEQVKSIIWNIKEGSEEKKEMLNQLFIISEVFHDELYKDALTPDEKKRMRTIQNFHIFLVKKTELEKYDAECKEEITKAYEAESKLSISDRMVLLKSKIPSNGSKQWIYGGNVLVHDYYTVRNANGNLVNNSKQNIALDLTPDNGKFVLTIFSRTWDPAETLKVVRGIGEGNTINTYSNFDPSRHALAVFDDSASNDEIAKYISNILAKVKDYRDKNYK